MKYINILVITSALLCFQFCYSQEEGFNKSALEIANDAINNIDLSKTDGFKNFQKTLEMSEKDAKSSEAIYNITKIQLKSMLQALLAESEKIDAEDISSEDKAKRMLTLLEKGKILLQYKSKSINLYVRTLTRGIPSQEK